MTSKFSIDINCDLGESIEPDQWEKDALLMTYISSCNIACGGHAGNTQSIETSINNALKHKLKIGAHPSFPDKKNFGRKEMDISEKDLRGALRSQLNTFHSICKKQQAKIHHIKPHGALYNLAAKDIKLAVLISEEVSKVFKDIALMGLAHSLMTDAANQVGIPFINEGFMDRYYHASGQLVSRKHPLAVHTELKRCLEQATRLATRKTIQTLEGEYLELKVDSICLHGDHENALPVARQLHQAFDKKDIQIQ